MKSAVRLVLLACASCVPPIASTAPIVPARDDVVVEQLPGRPLGLPRLSAAPARPQVVPTGRVGDALAAAAAARGQKLLDEARDRGDPRYAGYALAAIAPWRDDPKPPIPVALLAATIAQYQHDFDGARKTLEAIVSREPTQPQAWLTLATIARVQGRYADSDATCRRVPIAVYRAACLAENTALRGQFDTARRTLRELMRRDETTEAGPVDVVRWLTVTAAELEDRAGRPSDAEAGYRRALTLGRDAYLVLDLADLLLADGKADEATRLLQAEPKPYGDGVLLRLAIAAKARNAPDAKALATEMRERFDAARQRGDAISIHGRELARQLYALDGDARAAVTVARTNLTIQKEPADFLVMAEAASEANDAVALREVAAVAAAIGLVDVRLQRIVGTDEAR